jgi:hypothetical protein
MIKENIDEKIYKIHTIKFQKISNEISQIFNNNKYD